MASLVADTRKDDFERRVQMYLRIRGTPPIAPDPAYDEAQKRMGGGNPIVGLLQNLLGAAQPRRDLNVNVPVATMAGRVVRPGDTMQSAMGRLPMGELESGGLTAGATQTAMDLFRKRLMAGVNRFPNIDPKFEAMLQREINLGPPPNPHRGSLTPAQREFFERFYPGGAGLK
jgi:hypothetical protein